MARAESPFPSVPGTWYGQKLEDTVYLVLGQAGQGIPDLSRGILLVIPDLLIF